MTSFIEEKELDFTLSNGLDIIRKKIRNKELIGMDLSRLVGNEQIINKIHTLAEYEIKKSLKSRLSISNIDSEIVIISLSLIAMIKYSGNLYDHIDETYAGLYDDFSSQRIHGQIRNIINYHRTIENDCDWRIVSLVLKHAIVPMIYLPDFFDFIFDIYNINFNHILESNNLNEEFNFIYDGLKESMSADSDELKLNVTKKTYQLIKSTKDTILCEEYRSSICEFSKKIIELIDSYYWNDEKIICDNEYLNYGFTEWVNKNKQKEKIKRLIGESKTTFTSQWKPIFKLESSEVFLVPPIHKIKKIYDYTDIRIEISNEEEIIYENSRPEIFEIIGGFKVKLDNIKIAKPLKKLRYKITAGQEIIYDSGKDLWRDIIIFNTLGMEINNNDDYNGTAIFCYKNEANKKVNNYYNTNDYKLGVANVTETDVLTIDDVIVNFSKKLLPGIIGTQIEGFLILDNNYINIYQNIKYLVFETEIQHNDIGIRINNRRHKLLDFQYKIKRAGIYNNYIVELPVTDSNLYDVSVFNIKNDKDLEKCNFKFLIDKKLEYITVKQSKNIYSFELKTSFYPFTISKTIDITEVDNFDFYITINNDKYKLNLPYNVPVFKLNDSNWISVEDYIWIGDVKNGTDITTNGFRYDRIEITNMDNKLLTTIYSKKNGIFTIANIGSLRTYKEAYDFVILNFINDRNILGKLRCYNRCKINPNNIIMTYHSESKEFETAIHYYGKAKMDFSVYNYNDILIYNETINYSGQKIKISNFPSFMNIKISVSEKIEGFTINRNRIEAEWLVKYYSYDDLVGKYFNLHTVDFDIKVCKKLERRTFKLHNTFVEIFKRTDNNKFKGNIYTYRFDNKQYLDNINPVEIEILTNFVGEQVEVALTNNEDGLLIDFDNKTILNKLDDRQATDIFSCVLNLERKKNYDKVKSN